MKAELKDIVIEVSTKTAPAGGLLAWSTDWFAHINWNVMLGGLLLVIQIVYVLRKWWREETTWGLWMKDKTGVKKRAGCAPAASRPMEFDD